MRCRNTLAALCTALVVAAGCAGPGRPNEATRQDPALADAPPADKANAVPAEGLAKADIKLTIKVVDKECFGDAGCNVGYRVRAAWPTRRLGHTYEITYKVTGPKDGAQIGTLTVLPDGTYTGGEEFASTARSSTVLKPTVTEVEKLPY
jgi:hypothetical protein